MLMALPLILTFNDVLTKLVNHFTLYAILQDKVVPFQSQVVQLLLQPLGIRAIAYQDGLSVSGKLLHIEWNCLGWQSLLLFVLSLIVGLRNGSYTLASKLEVMVIGLFGIFWVNIFRMVFIVILSVKAPSLFEIIYHDILAAVVSLLYIFLFWGFSYKFVLEDKSMTGK
jgi:exosortase/archaeosortase family protein